MTQTPEKTLRDEFAMAVLTGLIAAGQSLKNLWIIEEAYEFADRCMQERMK